MESALPLTTNSLLACFTGHQIAWQNSGTTLRTTLETAADLNHDMIILGDFNTDILNNNSNRNLIRIMQKFDLGHTIKEATRITENTGTCLDLIMTNHKAIIHNTQILAPFQSDHCTVTAEISFKTY